MMAIEVVRSQHMQVIVMTSKLCLMRLSWSRGGHFGHHALVVELGTTGEGQVVPEAS